MSKIEFTVEVQVLDFSPLTRGQIDIVFNDGSRDITLTSKLSTSNLGTGWFQEIAFVTGDEANINEQQAASLSSSLNRDYRSIAGGSNLRVRIIDNTVEVSAFEGTFVSVNYTGNVLVVGTGVIENTVQITPVALGLTQDPLIGDCDNVQFSAIAAGGIPPYVLKDGSTTLETGWDGTASIFNLSRGLPHAVSATDSVGEIALRTQIVPRKLLSSEFAITSVISGIATDITITPLQSVSGVNSYEYSLDGITYKSPNVFTGLLEGNYTMYIRDNYNCLVTKTFNVAPVDEVDTFNPDSPTYFDVVDANSFIFTETVSHSELIKKNFNNTSSSEEFTKNTYEIAQPFHQDDFIVTQFKSSFPFHAVTLIENKGGKTDIPMVMVQENLGVKEKVDCMIFPVDGKMAIYFSGGNEYEPDTSVIIGSSIHTVFTPEWAIVGQSVAIDGIGTVIIESTGYDEFRGGYFIVSAIATEEIPAKIQVVFNKHDYNLFEFIIPISYIELKAKIVIEKGYTSDLIIGNPWSSEWIINSPETKEYTLIEWSDPLNRGGMVFQSGITCRNWYEALFRPIFDNETKNYKGDGNTFPLDMDAYQHYNLLIEAISAKEAYKLNIATGLDGLVINGVQLTRNNNPSIEPIEGTNLYTWECEFAYSGNGLSYDQDERVTNIRTGTIGGGSVLIDESEFPELYRIEEGGKFVIIDGKFIAVD